ncbi:sulfatase-like hydrolase/transferase [Novipirellula artificiosorum]|uniref:Arylsulfatase n=1 Tax=Novipirellula artificiosorum TaxID=2528016 RepID=A0A5C6DY36_9BACT|nr:sulfatase-like hydrolase/transferase [Novipirellula artificiosorum]TWU42353.1 Arylsulfatase precursor [Novipirellula artificiosorum]
MKLLLTATAAAACLTCSVAFTCSVAWPAEKPNIVLLFADDAGYADFGFQGSRQFKTPHLDELAASGVRLNQFYVTASVCGPSRAGLLTGRYQQRFGFIENNVPGIMSPNGRFSGEEMGLPLDLPTMGNHLQSLGYRTAIFGKWHMGEADRFHPTKRGFDEFFGFRGGARSFFAYPTKRMPNLGRRLERGYGDFKEHEGYLTDALADEACDYIERSKDKPFFAYVSFNAVHTPMEPDPKDREEFPSLQGKRRQVAQMTLSLDRACGQIIHKLNQLGLAETTLVVFANDNGGPTDANASSNYPLAGTKATQLEGGIRVPGMIVWPGKLAPGSEYPHPVSTLDLLPTFVKAAGGEPASMDGLDGVDLLPYLTGSLSERPHPTLYWQMDSRGSIRDGDWKMMRFPDRPAYLFNLADDPSEQNNLADTHPELLKSLYEKLFAWELELQRPLFMLRRQEEGWVSTLFDTYRKPPPQND